jgi:hypothetical protein
VPDATRVLGRNAQAARPRFTRSAPPTSAITAFLAVAELAGDPLGRADIEVEFRDAPHHQPSSLPSDKMAVYGFWHGGAWLKIGKAGPKSGPRYISQHYHLAAPSTRAKSLAADPAMRGVPGFDPADPGAWIRANTCRLNILLPATRSRELLSLMEAFLRLRLRPSYEG